MKAFSSLADRIGFVLLTLCVVAAPIPFGSNRSIDVGSFSLDPASLLGIPIALCLMGSVFVPVTRAPVRRLGAATLIISGLILLVTIVQIFPVDAGRWANAIWPKADGPIEASPKIIAASRFQPLHSVGYVLIPFAVFLSCLVYLGRDSRAIRFLRIVLGTASLVTAVCLVAYVVSPGTLLWMAKVHYLDSFTGTFVNRNSAATYFGILLVLALSFAAHELAYMTPKALFAFGSGPRRDERKRGLRVLAYGLCTAVLAAALLLTKSRAGILSTLAGVLIFLSAQTFLVLRERLSLPKTLAATAACLAAAIALFVVFGEGWIARIRGEGLFDQTRACAYASLLPALKEHIWLGIGFGTFRDVFPAYRLSECGIYGSWEMAHSVFIEGQLALGLVFPVLVILTYTALISTYMHGLRHRLRRRYIPLACLSILAVVTLHSAVDFSLQIPAVALLAASILGAGAALSLAKSRRNGTPF